MKPWIAALSAVVFAAAAHANGGHDHKHGHAEFAKAAQPAAVSSHDKEDIERHRAMARAHEQAAQCLEAGRGHGTCQKELQAACKGLALGKHCGMRHAH